MLSAIFPYQIQKSDWNDMLVTIGFDSIANSSSWTFFYWYENYTHHCTMYGHSDTPPAQSVLTGRLGQSENSSILLLYYGSTLPEPKSIRIDVFQQREEEGPPCSVTLPTPRSSQMFPINWPAAQPSEYLHWFLGDVDRDGILDLIGYASSNSNANLNVIVFPGRLDGDLGEPVVSNITLAPNTGSLFTSDFMFPVYTTQAAYASENGSRLDSSILSFFDNYGILGARMIAPVSLTGSFEYGFKGQTPAIAGQLSQGLSWRSANTMGRGEPGVAIGFAECC